MTSSKSPFAVVACSIISLLPPAIVRAQSPEMQQRVAALKQSAAQDQQRIRQYEWIETTVISLKGEDRASLQRVLRCTCEFTLNTQT